MKAIWEEIKNQISTELPKNTFSLWIQPITFIDSKEKSVFLGCPNKFSRNWVAENYGRIIQEKLANMLSEKLEVVLKVNPVRKETVPPDFIRDAKQLTFPNIARQKRNGRVRLNTRFTFDQFIVGPCNEFAYSASKALAHGAASNYQSLLIFANTGLGKSHLSHAVGHAILEEKPDSRVHYVTAEDFTNEMIFSLKNKRIEEFKQKYRKLCDVLLLEEIHFLSGKEKTQIELGYTLDALSNSNKNIVYTSSLPPKDIPRISKGLSSRFTSGLVTTIADPDYGTRTKILIKKASDQNVVLSDEICHFLARHLKRDIRQLESVVKCLKARSDLLNAKIDLSMAKDVVSSLVSSEWSITPKQIHKLVCRYYKVESDMLGSNSRKRIYAYPRNIYAYLCRCHTDETLEKLGETVNRSHSSILYASEVIARKMETDSRVRHEVSFLSKELEEMKK